MSPTDQAKGSQRVDQWKVRLPDGAHAAVTCWGGPEPRVLALHGLAHAGAAWSAFAAAVEGRAEVVAVDLRGHGDSDRDPTGLYSLETLVRDAVAVLDYLGVVPIVLVGHSLGGRIVAEIALQDLMPVTAAVVVDASPQPPETWLLHLERVHAGPPARAATLADYLRMLAQLYPLAEPEHLRPLAAATVRSSSDGVEETVDHAALRVWSANRTRSPWPERTGSTPLTLVRGAASSVLTRAVAAQLVAAQQVDQLVEVARSGHGVPLENPAGLAEAVLAAATMRAGTSGTGTSGSGTSGSGTSGSGTSGSGTSGSGTSGTGTSGSGTWRAGDQMNGTTVLARGALRRVGPPHCCGRWPGTAPRHCCAVFFV